MKSINIQTRDGKVTAYTVSNSTTHVIIWRSHDERLFFTPANSKDVVARLTKLASAGKSPIAYPVVNGKVTENA